MCHTVKSEMLIPLPLYYSVCHTVKSEMLIPLPLYYSVCHTVKSVTLLRSPTGSLGFSLVGGSEKDTGPNVPVHVKSVVMETPAAKDGRLK